MGLSCLRSAGCLTLGALQGSWTGICLKFFPVRAVILSYMDMYSWVVIYSQNVCPPVKLWQESVKIEKLVMLQGCVKEKSLGNNEGDPSLGWAPSGRGQSHFSWCVWVRAGWSSGSSPRAAPCLCWSQRHWWSVSLEGQVGELQQPVVCRSLE